MGKLEIRGIDNWNEGKNLTVDGQDQIEVRDSDRQEVISTTVADFLGNSEYDRYGSHKERADLIAKGLWRTPIGLRSGLPIPTPLKQWTQKLENTHYSARIRFEKGELKKGDLVEFEVGEGQVGRGIFFPQKLVGAFTGEVHTDGTIGIEFKIPLPPLRLGARLGLSGIFGIEPSQETLYYGMPVWIRTTERIQPDQLRRYFDPTSYSNFLKPHRTTFGFGKYFSWKPY